MVLHAHSIHVEWHISWKRNASLCCIFLKTLSLSIQEPGPWFNIKMTSYQYRKSHCGDKTILRSSYLHNGISYTDKMASLYWIRALSAYKTDASGLPTSSPSSNIVCWNASTWYAVCVIRRGYITITVKSASLLHYYHSQSLFDPMITMCGNWTTSELKTKCMCPHSCVITIADVGC